MKKYSFYIFTIMIFLALVNFQSCKKSSGEDPEVQTTSVVALSPGRALFKGNIVKKGSFNTLDYGFIYSTSNPNINETSGIKVSLGNNIHEGEFSKEVSGITSTNGYQPVLYVRAYLTNEKGTAFGKLTTVNLPILAASNVSPSSGKSGDQVTINGQFYDSAIGDIQVNFNNVKAKVLSVSASQIVVEVPTGIPASHGSQVSVQVMVGGQNLTISYGFTIKANIKDFSPKSGPLGTSVTFSGDNLPSSYYYSNDISILFDGIVVNNPYSSTVQVPSNVSSNNFKISVITNGTTTVLPGTFAVTAPTITSISPASGLPGSTVTINGTSLPTVYGIMTATIGTTTVNVNSYSDSQCSFTLPGDLTPGDYSVTLKAGPNSVTAPQKFKVVSPSLSSFSPSSGTPGTEITINGTFITGQYYTINFGSVSTSAYAQASNYIKVYVPTGVPTGNVKISAMFGSQTITAPGSFTVTAPTITSFAPTSGVPGTIVTITGTGFNSNYYGSTVAFGTINANILSVTNNTMQVTVPSNTGTGAMKITVKTNGQTVVSTDNFTVTN